MPIQKMGSGGPLGPRSVDWNDLKVILAVAETGNYTKAGEKLGITQATVSKTVKKLEDDLHVTLCETSANGVTLTDAGRRVADHALTVERTVRSLTNEVAMGDDEPAGLVSIGIPDALATYLAAPAAADFLDALPDLRLKVMCRERHDCDLSVQFQEAKRMEDKAISLGWVHYVHFAAQKYIDRFGSIQSVLDATRHRVVTHTEYKEQPERWANKIAALRALIDPSIITDCSPVMVQATANGAGICALPSYAALIDPRLVYLGTGEYARLRFWLVFDSDHGDVTRNRKAIEWLRTLFDGRKYPWFREEFIDPKEFAGASLR